MKPLRDNILVKEIKPERKTASGFYLSEDYDDTTTQTIIAEVVEIGDQAIHVTKGDKVIIHKYAGQLFEDLILVSEQEVYGIIDK